MSTQADVDAAFKAVRTAWNKAEGAIKLAEQVNGEIVNPAIYELRYAGRRIVEAFDLIDTDLAHRRLNDAVFDCHRARHDAIDAATSKMVAVLDNALDKIGPDIVLTHFLPFANFFNRLETVRGRIALSRENREDRDKIYATIETDDLSDLVRIFNEFRTSEPLMKASAKKARRSKFRSDAFGWAGVAGVVLTIAFFAYQTFF